MYEIQIPASVYQQAAQAAEAHHVSLADYVTEVLQLHLQDEDAAAAAFFTPQRIAEIREAQAEARTGKNITLEQYQAEAPQRRAEWQAKHPA